MPAEKHEIITLKVPESLKEAMKGVPNRSEFIRNAILTALDSVCPLCKGTGIFSARQKEHWDQFTRHHSVQECADCHALHLVCDHVPGQGQGS